MTISVDARTAVGKVSSSVVGNGWLLGSKTIEIADSDTVFSVLMKASRSYGLHMEYTGSASMPYIQGIGNLYERDAGPLSGWLFSVNGSFPNRSAGAITVKSGDVIAFRYTCDLGADIGAPGAGQG